MTTRGIRVGALVLGLMVGLASTGGCSSEPATSRATGTTRSGAGGSSPMASATKVFMDFEGTEGFYASPFPGDGRTIDGFPNPSSDLIASNVITMLQGATGFGLTSGIFFSLSGPIDPSDLPSLAASMGASASVFLMSIDPASPDYLKRRPIQVAFLADGGHYGAPNLLSALPLQGVPLRPKTRYAVVVTTSIRDTSGEPLAAMTAFDGGARPPGITDAGFATYRAATTALDAASVPMSSVAGLAAFTTGSPTDEMEKVVAAMIASPPKPSARWNRDEVFDAELGSSVGYCVYSTTIDMPDYQDSGGAWVSDSLGNPVLRGKQKANFVVTIPRSTMPAAGYPVVVLSRTGAGGNRPLVDRGQAVQTPDGGTATTAGSGPALYYANAGFAGSEIDGPLGGRRNPSCENRDGCAKKDFCRNNGVCTYNPCCTKNEDSNIFNVNNLVALRDNIRESAAELALQAHILESISIDVSDCHGAVAPNGKATFDVGHMALMGHSMGATIAPLSLAFEPRFKIGLLSGAGGSMIENVMYKLLPTRLLGDAEVLLELTGYSLTANDPMLSMFQWATEAADPPVYGRLVTTEATGGARNILMMEGIVDHYNMPPIANAMSLSLELDLAGEERDDTRTINYALAECGCNPSSPCYLSCGDECGPPTPFLSPTGECGECIAHTMQSADLCVATSSYAPVSAFLPLVGRKRITLPATENLTVSGGGKVSAILTQSLGDGNEDGHEVVFQTDPPKHQYGCFLRGMLSGTPTVPTTGTAFASCM